MENENKSRPAFEQRIGSIRLTLWKNQGQEGKAAWYSAHLVRRYRDKQNDEFKDAHTFNGVQDLLAVSELVSQALVFLREHETGNVTAAA